MNINYSLILAVREGRLERARELINSFGLSYSKSWSEGYVLLCEALESGHPEVIKLLLTSGSKVNSRNEKPSNTPLHFAVINGDIEIIKMILDKGAKIDAKNKDGRTPLHNAIIRRNMEVTELLLMHGADVNARDKDGTSPLHDAVKLGCSKIVEHLLNYGADVNCVYISTYMKGYTPLHLAVEKGSKEMITLLLSRGAKVDVKGEDGITPLHIASERGNEEAVKLFLNKGADINASKNVNSTPLHIATKRGCKTVVNLLLKHGAEVDNHDKYGKTTLNLAVERGCLTIVEDVLKYCPDINNKSNKSSFKIAVVGCGEEYKKIVVALLGYGLNVKPEDANNPEFLHAAVKNGYLIIIEDLLKFGADVNTLCNSTKESFTPLHCAAKHRQEDVAKLLISYGADINAQDKTGKPPIFYAIENGDLKITMLLLSKRANIKDSTDLLNIAVEKEFIEIVEALLQHDADINSSDEYGRTALHFTSCTHENPYTNIKGEIAKLLLSNGANVDAKTKKGVTTLYAAIEKGCSKVVEVLLNYNANVNIGAMSGITPLHLSVQKGSNKITTMLLNKGANVNAKNKDGFTALHIAAQYGYKEIVKVLLKCGANVDSKIKNCITPLHLGTKNGNQGVIETILKFGADINSRDEFGRTALHIASQNRQVGVVETLLKYGSDINITCRNNWSPIDHATTRRRSCQTELNYSSDDDYYYYEKHVGCSCEATLEALFRHIVKVKTANLYVSERNFLSVVYTSGLLDFQDECEKEIVSMKSEKINNPNVSFYDIVAKCTSSLEIYMRNENIVQVLKSEDYKTKFPIYASMIERHFRKAMERKDLLEQGNTIFNLLFNNFPELPYNCTEKIFSFLSVEDLRILMDA